ncbi:hypothetical protein N7449_004958, partial [Penicillium cf. viridicatum]
KQEVNSDFTIQISIKASTLSPFTVHLTRLGNTRRLLVAKTLQRILSLSSFESKETSSPSVSKEGDITEDEENSNLADESKEALWERRKKDGNAVALKYVAESIESSSTYNKTVRNDLANIFARLAIIETKIKKVAKQGNNKATED